MLAMNIRKPTTKALAFVTLVNIAFEIIVAPMSAMAKSARIYNVNILSPKIIV